MYRTLFAIVLLAIVPSTVRAQIGVVGGYNRDSFQSFSNDDFSLAESTNGFNTGVFLDFELGQFGIRPGINYRSLQDAIVQEPDGLTANLEIVEIPVDVRVSAPLPLLKPYLLAGVAVIFPSTARPIVDEALAGARLGVGVGFGAEWDVGFRLWPEIRYATSIGGIVEDDAAGRSRIETFVARLGISF